MFLDRPIKENALYDINKMPDHRGSLFQHKHSKLVQLKTYDINFNLIPTFRLSQTLKPGTVIMANCTLHCYITTGQFKSRKVTYIPPLSTSSFTNNFIYRHISLMLT